MDRDESELADALRTALGGPEPPVRTGLADIVRRGRRKVMVRRLVAAAGVTVVVAGIGVGASTLRDLQGQGNVQVAGLPTTLPAPVPTTSTSTRPGWTPVTPAPSDVKGTCGHWVNLPQTSPGPTVDGKKFDDMLAAALQKVAATAKIRLTGSTWAKEPPRSDGAYGSAWADIIDGGGGGSLYLQVRSYSGPATEAADADVYVDGTCASPQRKTLIDGTLLQLYAPVSNDPGHPSQALRVYTRSSHLYVLTAEGFASTDWTRVQDDPSQLTVPKGAGRGSLPLSEQQLADVGQILAAVG